MDHQKLLIKGSIVVKKAYCDWDRCKEFARRRTVATDRTFMGAA